MLMGDRKLFMTLCFWRTGVFDSCDYILWYTEVGDSIIIIGLEERSVIGETFITFRYEMGKE